MFSSFSMNSKPSVMTSFMDVDSVKKKKKKVCGRRFTLSCLTLDPNLLSAAHFMLQLAQIWHNTAPRGCGLLIYLNADPTVLHKLINLRAFLKAFYKIKQGTGDNFKNCEWSYSCTYLEKLCLHPQTSPRYLLIGPVWYFQECLCVGAVYQKRRYQGSWLRGLCSRRPALYLLISSCLSSLVCLFSVTVYWIFVFFLG